MKLSIIVCAYNTPKELLRASFESIKSSTISKYDGEYEICLVDDGSELDYSDLISEYNVKAIKTENRGIFSARMTGIEMAEGDYIAFCDSDDTVSSNYYLPMLELAMKEDIDIVINDWAYHVGSLKYYCKNDITIKKEISLRNEEIIPAFLAQRGRYHSFFVLWNKIYKSKAIKTAISKIVEIAYPEKSSYGEDALMNFFTWQEAKSVKNIHSGYYFYRIHQNQTVNVESEEKLKSQIYYMSKTLEAIENSLRNHIHAEKLLEYVDEWRMLSARFLYEKIRNGGYLELCDYLREQYGILKLEKPKRIDGCAYLTKKLLGDNFDEVDSIIRSLYSNDEVKTVKCSSDKYTRKCLNCLAENGKITLSKKKAFDIAIPKLKSSLKHKIIFDPIVYRLSLVLLGKNSRLRRILKKHI